MYDVVVAVYQDGVKVDEELRAPVEDFNGFLERVRARYPGATCIRAHIDLRRAPRPQARAARYQPRAEKQFNALFQET